MLLRHPYLLVEIPDSFEAVPAAEGLTYQFRDRTGDEILILLGERSASSAAAEGWEPAPGVVDIAKTFTAHAHQSGGKLIQEPIVYSDGRVQNCVTRVFYPATWQIAHARTVTTLKPILGDARVGAGEPIYPIVRITALAAADRLEDPEFHRFIEIAAIAPHAGANAAIEEGSRRPSDAPSSLFPYVITSTYVAQRDAALAKHGKTPEGDAGLPRLGDGLYLAIAQDMGEGVRVLFPSDVASSGLDWAATAELARENLLKKVGTAELPVSLHSVPKPPVLTKSFASWRPGMHLRMEDLPSESIFVVGESWLAASCVAMPELVAGAAAQLGTDQLVAFAPHRDRLFVFPDRGPAANEELARALAAVEDDGGKPLQALFRLTQSGPIPLA